MNERYTEADKRMVLDTIRTECKLAKLGPMSEMVILGRIDRALVYSINFFSSRGGQVESVLKYGRELVAEHRQTDDIVRRIIARNARHAA